MHAKSDDRYLYEINAKVAQELRQNQSPANIKNILEKFKADNPQIIENLRDQNRKSTSESTSYSKAQTTSNDNNNNFSESNIFNDITTRNDSNVMNNPSTADTKKKDLDEEIVNDFGNKYTAVKSSTELLNTFLHPTDVESDISEMDGNDESSQEKIQFTNETNNTKQDYENINSDPKTIEKSYSILDDSNPNNSFKTTQYKQRTSNDDNSDSEIAIALTQVIAENSDSQRSEILSSEDELFIETVQEIREYMKDMCLETCILTPPEGFRDD